MSWPRDYVRFKWNPFRCVLSLPSESPCLQQNYLVSSTVPIVSIDIARVLGRVYVHLVLRRFFFKESFFVFCLFVLCSRTCFPDRANPFELSDSEAGYRHF